MTLLHWAADGGHSDMLRLLLARGAAVNAQVGFVVLLLLFEVSAIKYAA